MDHRDAVDGVHRAAQSGGYCAAKSPPRIDPFTWGVARHPLRPFDHGDSKRIDRVPFPMKRKRLPWWIRFDGLVRPSNAVKNYLRM